MSPIRRATLAALPLAVAVCAALPAAAQPLACPVPHADAGPGVLKETATQMREVGAYLVGSADPNRIPDVIHDLRERHPGVSDGEVQNYLVAAYCPEVAKLNGLSPTEQDAQVQRFARQVETDIHRN